MNAMMVSINMSLFVLIFLSFLATAEKVGRVTNLGGSKLSAFGGATAKLTPGIYTFVTDISISGNMYFEGTGTAEGQGESDVFIIQTTGDLLQAANYDLILSNGALADNIFWQAAGRVTVINARIVGDVLPFYDFVEEKTLLSKKAQILSEESISEHAELPAPTMLVTVGNEEVKEAFFLDSRKKRRDAVRTSTLY
jgi:hypothetical protein